MTDKKTRFNQAVWQITQALHEEEVLDNALSSCLETVISTLGCEAGTIWVLESKSDRLYPIFNQGPVDITGITIANGQGVAGSVVKEGKSVIVECLRDLPDRFRKARFLFIHVLCPPHPE